MGARRGAGRWTPPPLPAPRRTCTAARVAHADRAAQEAGGLAEVARGHVGDVVVAAELLAGAGGRGTGRRATHHAVSTARLVHHARLRPRAQDVRARLCERGAGAGQGRWRAAGRLHPRPRPRAKATPLPRASPSLRPHPSPAPLAASASPALSHALLSSTPREPQTSPSKTAPRFPSFQRRTADPIQRRPPWRPVIRPRPARRPRPAPRPRPHVLRQRPGYMTRRSGWPRQRAARSSHSSR